jgi:hypothetical protein
MMTFLSRMLCAPAEAVAAAPAVAPAAVAAPAAAPAVAPVAPAAPASAPAAAPPPAAPAAPAKASDSIIVEIPKTEVVPPKDAEKAATEAIKENYKPTIESVQLKVPEGVTVDAQVLTDVKELAIAELSPSERAQKTLELGMRQAAAFQAKAETAFKTTVDAWREATKADPDIGGAKLPAAQAAANRAIAAFGGQPLADILKSTGVANHPAVVKAFARAGATISEDSIAGSLQGAAPKDAPQTQSGQAAAMGYGKMAQELKSRGK